MGFRLSMSAFWIKEEESPSEQTVFAVQSTFNIIGYLDKYLDKLEPGHQMPWIAPFGMSTSENIQASYLDGSFNCDGQVRKR